MKILFMSILLGVLLSMIAVGSSVPTHQRLSKHSKYFEHRQKSDALVEAASEGDLKKMEKLLKSGISADSGSTTKDEGVSALSAAASNSQLGAVKLLLIHHADVNADDYWGGNALVGASMSGNVEMVRLLLKHGAYPNMADDGTTALDYAQHQITDHTEPAPIANYKKIVSMLRKAGGYSGIQRMIKAMEAEAKKHPEIWMRGPKR